MEENLFTKLNYAEYAGKIKNQEIEDVLLRVSDSEIRMMSYSCENRGCGARIDCPDCWINLNYALAAGPVMDVLFDMACSRPQSAVIYFYDCPEPNAQIILVNDPCKEMAAIRKLIKESSKIPFFVILCRNIEKAKETEPENDPELLKKYHNYQLRWMMEHGYSLKDLMDSMEEYTLSDEYFQNLEPESGLTSQIFREWEYNCGFGGEIWACFKEWLETEYQYEK